MKLGLSGKVAVVTGASRGLGRAIALSLGSEGVRLALFAREQQELENTSREIARMGVSVRPFHFDITRPEAVRPTVEEVLRLWGAIDILVNNAGGPTHDANFLELSDGDWQESLDLNFFSVVRLCREVIPAMQRQKKGRIINIASVAGRQIEPKFPDYGVSKSAVLSLTKYLSVEFAKDNILVNAVAPGPVWTPSWEREAARRASREQIPQEEAARRLAAEASRSIPAGRMGAPEDIAPLVVFLASEQSGWITGSCVTADGGMTKALF